MLHENADLPKPVIPRTFYATSFARSGALQAPSGLRVWLGCLSLRRALRCPGGPLQGGAWPKELASQLPGRGPIMGSGPFCCLPSMR